MVVHGDPRMPGDPKPGWPWRRKRTPNHGYPLPDGTLEPDKVQYLLVLVREWYATTPGATNEELEARVVGALAGDAEVATPEEPFMPIQLARVWR